MNTLGGRPSERPPRWNEVTAIFGGQFDPPHLGHRQAVRGLFEHPGLREVLIVPSGTPPHKTTRISAQNRAEMAALNFKPTVLEPSYPKDVRIDLREIVRSEADPLLPSYTFDTLQELRPHYPSLACVIGVDQLTALDTWHRFPEILSLCHWIVLKRKPFNESAPLRVLSEWTAGGLIQEANSDSWKIKRSPYWLTLIPTAAPLISSTQVREAIARSGTPPSDTLLPEVWGYLKKNKLYGI